MVFIRFRISLSKKESENLSSDFAKTIVEIRFYRRRAVLGFAKQTFGITVDVNENTKRNSY